MKIFVGGYTLDFDPDTLEYAFRTPEGDILFSGNDFRMPECPTHGTDAPETIEALLSFLCLRPGDVDAEYFAGYTEAQMAFAEGDAEAVGLAAYGHDWEQDDDDDEAQEPYYALSDWVAEEAGDASDGDRWYGLIRGPFVAAELRDEGVSRCEARELELTASAGCILSCDSQGFRHVEMFELKAELEAAWKECEACDDPR
jgi:hypothetical protein